MTSRKSGGTERTRLVGTVGNGSFHQYGSEAKREAELGADDMSSNSPSNPPIRTYYSRYWILFAYSLLAWMHCVQWNTFGPISESMGMAFSGWGSSTVAMVANWGTIMFVVFVMPMCWAIQRFGLRFGIVGSAALMAVGTGLRCISRNNLVFTVTSHMCGILTGVASTLILAAPPLIGSSWFPANERVTAIGFMMGASQFGFLGSYLEPLIVRVLGPGVTVEEIQDDIMRLMYIGAGSCTLLLLAVLVYFPSKPPTPPSVTSTTERLEVWDSFKALAGNKPFLLLLLPYGMLIGPSVVFVSVMNYSLLPLGFHQDEAMYVGLCSVAVSSFSPIISGRFGDVVHGKIKPMLIFLMFLSAFFYYWFLLLSYGVITPTKWQVYVSVVMGLAINYATIPLFFEVGVDLAYPVPEIIVSGIMTAADNIFSVLFLLVFFIPNAGYLWVTYTLVLSCSVTAIPMLFVKTSETRNIIDCPEEEN